MVALFDLYPYCGRFFINAHLIWNVKYTAIQHNPETAKRTPNKSNLQSGRKMTEHICRQIYWWHSSNHGPFHFRLSSREGGGGGGGGGGGRKGGCLFYIRWLLYHYWTLFIFKIYQFIVSGDIGGGHHRLCQWPITWSLSCLNDCSFIITCTTSIAQTGILVECLQRIYT